MLENDGGQFGEHICPFSANVLIYPILAQIFAHFHVRLKLFYVKQHFMPILAQNIFINCSVGKPKVFTAHFRLQKINVKMSYSIKSNTIKGVICCIIKPTITLELEIRSSLGFI